MPTVRREAETLWARPLARGTGTLTTASGALEQLAVTRCAAAGRSSGRGSIALLQAPRGGGSEAMKAARVS